MKFSISENAKQLADFYKKLGKTTIIAIFSILGIVVAGAILITVIMNNGKYAELYTGLSTAEAAEIYSLLEEMAVDVKVEDEDTILVPTDDVATLKMQLAVEGYPKSALSYDIFTEQSSLLTTDYEKKQLLIFQLQERIQESVKTLQGVNDVIVTLSIPEDNSYVLKDDEVPTTASVILKMNGSTSLSSSQINGIENLVANSVTGLENENVVIIDGEGVQLNSKDKDSSGVDSAFVKVETANIINDVYEKRIRDFLKPILGENGMSVAVNVVVDFDVVSSEETIYTPVIGENGIISWVERTGTTKTDESGTDTNTPIYTETSDDTSDDTSVDVSTDVSDDTSGETSSSETSSGSSTSNESFSAEYLVNQLVRIIQDNGGNITDVSVALIINSSELSEENIEKYKELVAFSTGISTEKVTIKSAEFLAVEASDPFTVSNGETSVETGSIVGMFQSMGVTGIILIASILLLLAFLVLMVLSLLKMKKKMRKIISTGNFSDSDVDEKTSIKKPRQEDMPGEIVLNETREQALKRQIKEFSFGNPETVAQLLRVWMKEDENK